MKQLSSSNPPIKTQYDLMHFSKPLRAAKTISIKSKEPKKHKPETITPKASNMQDMIRTDTGSQAEDSIAKTPNPVHPESQTYRSLYYPLSVARPPAPPLALPLALQLALPLAVLVQRLRKAGKSGKRFMINSRVQGRRRFNRGRSWQITALRYLNS